MRNSLPRLAATVFASVLLSAPAWAAPKIAVTDLSYEEKVSGYFENVEIKGKRSYSNDANDRSNDSGGSSSERTRSREDVSVRMTTQYETHIDQGELRKFTADIKGGLLKSGYRVVQGKPWVQKRANETVHDIIGRIKQGYYPGADYVLWGTVSNVEFRKDVNPVQGSSNYSAILALELVAEFSLINTRTYEIKVAFSAMGEGSDVKLVPPGAGLVTNNRSRVMQDVARSLGEVVVQEIEGQFGEGAPSASSARSGAGAQVSPVNEERVIQYR
jgi:hypothetical protein